MTEGQHVRPPPTHTSNTTTLAASAVPTTVRALPAALPAKPPIPSLGAAHRAVTHPSPFQDGNRPKPTKSVALNEDASSVTSPSASTSSAAPSESVTPTSPAPAASTDAAAPEQLTEKVFCVEDDERLTTVQHMTAGAMAGMTEHMAMYPVDTIKTRMQSYVGVRDFAQLGIVKTTRTIVATEGLPALWRGVGAVALSAGPAHALSFATYEAVRAALAPSHREDGQVHAVATATAGACATVVGDGIMTPLDVVKQRMQLSGREMYGSVLQCTRHVWANHGLRAFFAGYKPTLLMNVPFTAVYFSGYETAKKAILEWRGLGDAEFSATSHCIAGGVAGAAAAAATNPLDVVKTRLQTQGEIGARRYRGLADALRSIRVEEGVAGLMRGVRPRVLFHMPAAAVCWTTYEFCKHVMHGAGMHGKDGAALH